MIRSVTTVIARRTGDCLPGRVGPRWGLPLSLALCLLAGCSSQPSKPGSSRVGAEKKVDAPAQVAPVNNPDRITDQDNFNPVIMIKPQPDAGPCVTCDPTGGHYCGEIGDNCGHMLDCGDC